MQRVILRNQGPEVSEIIYGTWRFKEDSEGFAPARLRAKVDACLQNEITTLDLADIYGDYSCHAAFGKLFAEAPELRERVELITKCGILAPCGRHADEPVKHYNATRDYVVASVESALRELHTDRIDLLLIHRPDWLTPADETAAALQSLMESGKILHAGVSNFSWHQFDLLDSLLGGRLATNQIELSLFHMASIYDGVLAQCEKLKMRPIAWSPTGGGRLFASTTDAASARIAAVMAHIAPRYGNAAPAELALAWICALPARPLPILGTNQISRIVSGSGASAIHLDRKDWYRLWEAAQGQEIP